MKACEQSLEKLIPILEIDDLLKLLSRSIDQSIWESCKSQEPAVQPSFFISFAIKMRALGRIELARVPARVQIAEANVQHWHNAVTNIRHLSNVISSASPIPLEEQRHFLSRVVTTEWMDDQSQRASVGALAGSLFAILVHLDRTNWVRFASASLERRIDMELSRAIETKIEEYADVVSLLGVYCQLAGAFHSSIKPITTKFLTQLILTREPAIGQTRVSILQLQLWLGIREVARLQEEPMRVPKKLGDTMQAVVQANAAHAEKTAELNAELMAWLEKSRSADWILARK